MEGAISSHSRLAYRPDIDGLRAIAVLAVVAFHTLPGVVPGGFVGVDVFFVISGFLISSLLLEQLEQGRFSLADFFARRIRRIFPALAVVLLAVASIGWYVLIGDEYAELQKHIAGGSFFTANIVLWRHAGYFDGPSAYKPLLHLWSLAVEEQFYLFWPPALYLCWKRGINVLSLIVLVIVCSFSLNLALVRHSATAAFYLPTSRMWELLLGGLLAYVECFDHSRVNGAVDRLVFTSPARADKRFVANGKAWIGLTLLILSIAVLRNETNPPAWWSHSQTLLQLAEVAGLDSTIAYPGWWAILPTLGTALLIWAGTEAWVNREILAWRPMVYVGLMSYPLYLWHWPLLSFLRITESGHPSLGAIAAAVALAFILAWLTYRFVEQPIRRMSGARFRLSVAMPTVAMVIIGVTSLYAYHSGALMPMTPNFPTALTYGIPSPRHDRFCSAKFPTAGEYCQQYVDGGSVTTALLGDSHAEHFLSGVGAYLAKRGENVVHLGESGCPPLMYVQRLSTDRADTCHNTVPSVIDTVRNDSTIARVILSFRGDLYVTGTGYGEDRLLDVNFGIAGSGLAAPDAIRQSLYDTVQLFLGKKKVVWLILEVPELSLNLGDCTGRPVSFEHRILKLPCAESKAAVIARQAPYRTVVEAVRRQLPALRVFDPLPYMCDEQWCYAVKDQKLLYLDDHHLSREGSLFFADKFAF